MFHHGAPRLVGDMSDKPRAILRWLGQLNRPRQAWI